MSSNYFRKPVAWPRMLSAAAVDDGAVSPAALVLGVQWINPLMWRDYPTQWNLLWVQGLAQANANDKDAARFKLGDVVGELVRGGLKPGETPADYPRAHFDRRSNVLSDVLRRPLRTFKSYVVDPQLLLLRPHGHGPSRLYGHPGLRKHGTTVDWQPHLSG